MTWRRRNRARRCAVHDLREVLNWQHDWKATLSVGESTLQPLIQRRSSFYLSPRDSHLNAGVALYSTSSPRAHNKGRPRHWRKATMQQLLRKCVFAGLAGLVLTAGIAFAADPTPGKNLFQLEVIAYAGSNCPQGDFIGTNRHQIAVKADVNDNPSGQQVSTLVRQNDIMLAAGDDFQVVDGNACIDGVARFQLPANPIGGTLDDPTFQNYLVYGRLVGKPGTGVDVRTCATNNAGTPDDPSDDFIQCSTENWVEVRSKGPGSAPKYSNVSKSLLTVCLDTNADLACDTRVALFDAALYDYFWNWNTTGKAHAQLVFTAVPD